MTPRERAAQVRRTAGLFAHDHRGLIAVQGGDRVRWLDGMVSGDVAALTPGRERSGCYALLLTPQGRIVADLHVLHRDEELWLETAALAVAPVAARLQRYLIADDVVLEDRSASYARLGLEGPAAGAVLQAAAGEPVVLSADACADLRLGGVSVVAAGFGWSGEAAFQLFLSPEDAAAVEGELREAGSASGLVEGSPEVLEILRIEAGVPSLFAELDEEVLPAEVPLQRAVSTTKGCYTGQEVVARMDSRGRVAHRLVGLRTQAPGPPPVGTEVRAGERVVGEVTSACHSALAGPIALAFVRSACAEPETPLRAGSLEVTVAPLPFVAVGGGSA